MDRAQAIELMKKFQLADIIAAIQEAYRLGFDEGQRQIIDDDDIPF